jgi:hypothetical protein
MKTRLFTSDFRLSGRFFHPAGRKYRQRDEIDVSGTKRLYFVTQNLFHPAKKKSIVKKNK